MRSKEINRIRRIMIEKWIEKDIEIIEKIEGEKDIEEGEEDLKEEREKKERMMGGKGIWEKKKINKKRLMN